IKEGYKQTPVGVIPEDWEVKKFKECFNQLRTYTYSRKQLTYKQNEDDIYNIHYGDIHAAFPKNILDTERNLDLIPIIIDANIEEPTLLKDGDLIMADASEDYEGVGQSVELIKIGNKKIVAGTHTFALRPKISFAPKYTGFIFSAFQAHKALKKIATGISVFGLSKFNIAKVKLPIPPLPEQKAIADCLSTWDNGIEKLTAIIQSKKEQKKGLMQQIFNGQLKMENGKLVKVVDENLWLEGWKEVMIKNLTDVFDGTHQTPKYVENGVPFYSVEHLTADDFENTKYISEKVFIKENKRVKLEKGDVLMTRIGDIGTSKYIDWDVNASFYVTLILFKKKSQDIDFRFFHFFISTDYFQNELHKRTLHVAFPKKINLGDVKLCKVIYPSLEEQTAIAEVLTTADKEIELLENKLEFFKTQKKGLMQVLLTGEKRLVS
ncbi:MAG: restriction endonuclease subunit S, partial [Flavobacteriaceae bacterium]